MAVKVLEQGNIYFFYRPKKAEPHPESVEDIQRLFLVLQPKSGPTRLIIVGRKELPEMKSRKERFWGFVDKIADAPAKIGSELDPAGDGQAARPAGEGVYQLVSHEGRHTHLVYGLELPKTPGEVQDELRIKDEASYILSVKNPDQPSPPGTGLQPEGKADYPAEIMERFGSRKFISAEPELLDYDGAEILFVGATEHVKEELGQEPPRQDESVETAEIFRELKLERKRHPVEPLLKGRWQ